MTQPSNAIEVVPDFPEALPGRRRCRLGRRRRRRRPGQRVEALGRRRDDHVTARRRRQQRRRKRQIGGGNVDEAVVGGRQVQGLLDEREQLLVVVGWALDASARGRETDGKICFRYRRQLRPRSAVRHSASRVKTDGIKMAWRAGAESVAKSGRAPLHTVPLPP